MYIDFKTSRDTYYIPRGRGKGRRWLNMIKRVVIRTLAEVSKLQIEKEKRNGWFTQTEEGRARKLKHRIF